MTRLRRITYIILKEDPEPGERGDRGPISRFRKFVTGVEYQCGAEGEEFLDYSWYDGLWYRCLVTHTPTGNQNPYDEIGHGYNTWRAEPAMQFMSTGCMVVGENGEGWILENGQIRHTSGKVVLSSDGSANFNNKCTISADGILKSKGGVFEGRLQIPFQYIYGGGVFNMETGSAIILAGGLTLPSDEAYNGYILEIWGNNILSKNDMIASLYGEIVCPWLTQESGSYTHVYVATSFHLTKGGYLKLACIGRKWAIIGREYSTAEYYGSYSNSPMF